MSSAGRVQRLAIVSSRRRSMVAAAVGVLVVVGATGCGSDDPSQPSTTVQGVGELRAGSSAPLAQCADWRRGTVAEREQTVVDIRDAITPDTPATAEADLSDADAYDLFQRVCAQEYAAGFRLYKVYGQAAAFAPLRPAAGE